MNARTRTPVFLLLLLASFCPAAAFIDISGPLSEHIDKEYLAANYRRIYSILAPHEPVDTSRLTLISCADTRDRHPAMRLPEWGGGGTLGRDTIIVPIDRAHLLGGSLNRVCVHETVHAVLNRAWPSVIIPRWFHEGCAMMLSGELSFDGKTTLSRAVFGGRLLALATIDSVNTFPESRARLAYSQSHATVQFLADTYGLEFLAFVLTEAAATGNFEQGIHATLGMSTGELEIVVLNHLRKRYGLMFLFGDLFYLWFGITLLALAGYIATRIRNRRRKEIMDFDEEEGDH